MALLAPIGNPGGVLATLGSHCARAQTGRAMRKGWRAVRHFVPFSARLAPFVLSFAERLAPFAICFAARLAHLVLQRAWRLAHLVCSAP